MPTSLDAQEAYAQGSRFFEAANFESFFYFCTKNDAFDFFFRVGLEMGHIGRKNVEVLGAVDTLNPPQTETLASELVSATCCND